MSSRAQAYALARWLGLGGLICVCVFLAWAYAIFMRAPAIGTFHDDGLYLVTAKALAEGDGYRIVSLPGEPRQTKYPILFPWVLSLVWRIYPTFPNNLPWLRIVPFSAAVVWLWLSWILLRRLGASRPVATIALLLTAISPWTLFLSTALLSETLFAAFATAGLIVLLRIHTGRGGRFDAVAAGALMGASVLSRVAGVGLAGAGILVFVAKRKWSAAGLYVASVVAVSGPWFWWVARHAAEPIVDPFYSGSNYASWNIIRNYAWPDKVAVLEVNTFWAVQFGQFWGLALGTRPAWIAAGICSVLALRGLWIERGSPASWLFVAYFGLLLAWAFPPLRFMVPVLPLLVWYMFVGAGRAKPLAGALALLLVVSSGIATWRLANATKVKGGTWYSAGMVDDWHAMSLQYEWIARNTPPESVLIATHDPTSYLFTGRKGLRPSSLDPLMLYYNVRGRSEDPADVAEAFRRRLSAIKADYVVVTSRDFLGPIERLSTRFPGSFTVVDGDPASHFAIYRVDRGRLSDGG